MKLNRILIPALVAAAFCSCSDDPKDDPENDWIVYFDDVNQFTSDKYWKFCYDEKYQDALTFYNNNESVNFSHSCQTTEYYGVWYYSWKGFTPSCATDLKNYNNVEGEQWTDHQWTAMPGRGMLGQANYMIACCDSQETAADATTSTTAVIKPVSTSEFVPKYVYLTNTTWGYYAMLQGSAFSKAFTSSDWCKVTISGVSADVVTGSVDFYLAKDGEYVTKWTNVDLSEIGKCEKLVYTMESTDSGQWGMNNPAYFALGAFQWGY